MGLRGEKGRENNTEREKARQTKSVEMEKRKRKGTGRLGSSDLSTPEVLFPLNSHKMADVASISEMIEYGN